jgi:hypothetical protein
VEEGERRGGMEGGEGVEVMVCGGGEAAVRRERVRVCVGSTDCGLTATTTTIVITTSMYR